MCNFSYFSGGEVAPGQDPKDSLKETLTKLLCKETEGAPPIEWNVTDVVSAVFTTL